MTGVDVVSLAVLSLDSRGSERAHHLARDLDLPLLPAGTHPADCAAVRAVLLVGGDSLALQLTGRSAPGPVSVDFGASSMRYRRRAGHNELLGRAVGTGKIPKLAVIDGTAGLGRDSFVLADLGCRVKLCERNAVVYRLLEQGIRSALGSGDPWLESVSRRMCLHEGDVRTLSVVDSDVIYLDPMFPQRDKTAAVKKEMAMFHILLGNDVADGEALLAWALDQPVRRVVVKRPPRAEALTGAAPSHSISGKAVRFDVYVKRPLA